MSRTKIQVGDVVRRRPEWKTTRRPDASVIGTLRVTAVDDVGNGDLFWTEEFGPTSSLDQQAFEIVVESSDVVPVEPATPPPLRVSRERALELAEAYTAETVPTVPPIGPNGYPISGWRQTAPAERLQLVLETARFLLGEV